MAVFFLSRVVADKSSSAGRITKAPVLVLSSCQGTIIAVRSVAQIGETIFVDLSLQKTQLLRSELILFGVIDILAGFTCC